MILYSTTYCSGSQYTQVICTLCIESVSPLNNIDQYMPACLCQQKRGLVLQKFILSLTCSNSTRPCSTLHATDAKDLKDKLNVFIELLTQFIFEQN